MFKMSTGVAALLVVGLLGLACTNQAGLNPGEERGVLGVRPREARPVEWPVARVAPSVSAVS